MSDQVQITLITCAFNLLIVVVSRVLSHNEHKQTSARIEEIHKATNGRGE